VISAAEAVTLAKAQARARERLPRASVKAAEGIGKGAGDLVTLHPAGAAENVGKGAGDAGKDIGVGAVKGTGKIGKGTGKLIAKPFHHSKKNERPDTPAPSGETPR
jgi:hypothetical protein